MSTLATPNAAPRSIAVGHQVMMSQALLEACAAALFAAGNPTAHAQFMEQAAQAGYRAPRRPRLPPVDCRYDPDPAWHPIGGEPLRALDEATPAP